MPALPGGPLPLFIHRLRHRGQSLLALGRPCRSAQSLTRTPPPPHPSHPCRGTVRSTVSEHSPLLGMVSWLCRTAHLARCPLSRVFSPLVHPAGCSILQGAACPGHQRRSSSSLLKTQPISCWPSLAVSFRGLPPSSCFILRDPRDGPSYPRVSRWLDLRGTSQHSGPANPSSAHSQDPAFIERRGPGPPAPLALALLQASPRAPIVSRNHSLPPACPWSKQLPCLSSAMSPTEHIAAWSTHTG